jgi:hypothetical protein
MSRTQIRLELLRPPDAAMLERLLGAHSIYGLLRVAPEGAGSGLLVEFDATRLNEQEVVSLLRRLGVPVSLPRSSAVPSPA